MSHNTVDLAALWGILSNQKWWGNPALFEAWPLQPGNSSGPLDDGKGPTRGQFVLETLTYGKLPVDMAPTVPFLKQRKENLEHFAT